MLDDRLLIVAERNAQPLGFVVVSPVAARNGWLVEQIVRGRGAPNGTAELMIDAAMREISRRGATYATLGLCPLSSHSQFEQNRMPPWLRLALRLTRAHGKRFYNFAGLDAFKNKFAPEEWEEIVALADAKAFPPKTLWAIAAAFSNGSPLVLIAKATWRALVLELSWLLDRFRTSTT